MVDVFHQWSTFLNPMLEGMLFDYSHSDREVGDSHLQNQSYSFIWLEGFKKGIAHNGRQTSSPRVLLIEVTWKGPFGVKEQLFGIPSSEILARTPAFGSFAFKRAASFAAVQAAQVEHRSWVTHLLLWGLGQVQTGWIHSCCGDINVAS